MTTLQAEVFVSSDGSLTLSRPLPSWVKPGKMQMTLLVEDGPVGTDDKLARRRQALAKLRQSDPFRSIADPERWQREMRSDRALPGHA